MYNIIRNFYFNILNFISIVYSIIFKLKGIKVGNKLKLRGFPHIIRYPNSNIYIGNKCKINSSTLSNGIGLNHSSIIRTIGSGTIIKIGNNVGISGGTILARKEIIIDDNVLLGANCFITDSDHHPLNPIKRLKNDNKAIKSSCVHIKSNSFIGAYSIILKGVTIGENSIIGAGSVVFNDIPDNCIARGNPAVIVKKFT